MTSVGEPAKALLAKKKPLKLGVFLFDGYEILDVYGPLEMFGVSNVPPVSYGLLMEIITIGPGTTPLAPQVVTNFAIGDPSVPQLDILMLPGGNGWQKAIEDDKARQWIAKAAAEATLVFTVCTGAGFCASLGLLDGRRATTNKMDLPSMAKKFPQVKWQAEARWVCDGKFYTSSGVSAGADLALHILRELVGPYKAQKVSKITEFVAIMDPDKDPFVGNGVRDWGSIHPVASAVSGQARPIKVGVLLYDNFEMLDTFGPMEIFAVANRFEPGLFSVTTMCETEVVKSSLGPRFRAAVAPLPDPECGLPFDLLFVPGGLGTIREVHNPACINWIRAAAGRAKQVMTVCSGSAMLAATGLLDGRKVTTNKISFNLMMKYGPKADWQREARFVVDGKFLTSSGVTAGTDLALHYLSVLFGMEFAEAVAQRAEFVWTKDGSEDPFSRLVPPNSFVDRVKNRCLTGFLWLLFSCGKALGFSMRTSQFLTKA